MSTIGKAFENFGHGIKNAFVGVGNVIKGVCTLDLKGVGDGMKKTLDGVAEAGRGAIGLTPPALAANSLMDGAFDKMIKDVQGAGLNVAGKVIDSAEGGATDVKTGVCGTFQGLARHDGVAMLGGMLQAGSGASQLAELTTPSGLAATTGIASLETALEKKKPSAAPVRPPSVSR